MQFWNIGFLGAQESGWSIPYFANLFPLSDLKKKWDSSGTSLALCFVSGINNSFFLT